MHGLAIDARIIHKKLRQLFLACVRAGIEKCVMPNPTRQNGELCIPDVRGEKLRICGRRGRSVAPPPTRKAPCPSSRSAAPAPSGEPVFEPVDQHPLKARRIPGRRRSPAMIWARPITISTALCKRVKGYFSGPPAANAELINYLAAGNVHGLRPLRKEKRIARNRFLTLALIFVAVLFGIFSSWRAPVEARARAFHTSQGTDFLDAKPREF